MSGPTLRGMHLPDDVVADGIDWRCTENGKTATSGETLVTTAGNMADSPADTATATGQGTAQTPKRRRHQGKASIKRHRQNQQRQRRAKKRQAREAAHEVH